MHTPKVKAVVFDIGNVLVEVNIACAMALLGPHLEAHVVDKVQGIGQWATYDAFERGQLRDEDFVHALRTHLALDLSAPELVTWWNASLEKMVDGVEQVLSDLLERLPVYALSNTNPLHFDHFMRHMPLLQRFERVVTSFHVGYRKPEPQLFEAAAHLMGHAPADLLFIDDLMANVAGAKAVGYQAEHCVRSSQRLRDILVRYGALTA